MTEVTATSSDAAAQRAAEQARLRKERREAKIKAGGSARLNKITGMGGRIPGDSEPTPAPSASPTAAAEVPAAATATDPEEVDISEHYYAPKATARKTPPMASSTPEPSLSEAQLRQMMLGLERPEQSTGGTPAEEDPLMKMMSQMMAGAIPGGSPFPNMPMPQQQEAAAKSSSTSLSLWRILHALVALGLGLFFVFTTHFTGTKVERERTALAFSSQEESDEELEQRKRIFFWTFATAEVLLLSSRFFLDTTSTQPTGFVATAVSYIPQPYRGYLQIGQRYVQIFTTVRADIFTCVFILGLCTWWKG